MAMKSKWKSQQIHKQFKNKHRNDFNVHWSSKSNHSTPFVRDCNEFHKNIYTNYNNQDELYIDEEYDEYHPSYWSCSECTYNNIERDLYCFVCQSPFKSPITPNKYSSDFVTLSDHLPAILDFDKDDMDQSIQIAIMCSFDDILPKQSNSELYGKSHIKIKTKEQIERDRRKQREQEKRKKAQKLKREKMRKLQQQERIKREKEEKERKYIAKCFEQCPKLENVIGPNTIHLIRENMEKQYKNSKQFKIKFILNYDVLLRFLSKQSPKDNEWEFVYHGTDCKNDEGIIKNGLIVGGTKGVRIRNGSCYGKGIYCSPRTGTASSYERGSMFICIVRDTKVRRNGAIWVVPNEYDILPLYLVSFPSYHKHSKNKPIFPYFPIPVALQELLKSTKNNVVSTNDDGLSQQILKFIPSFTSLNSKPALHRKIRRKWNAYYKINQYQS